jgi:hypothetical protein
MNPGRQIESSPQHNGRYHSNGSNRSHYSIDRTDFNTISSLGLVNQTKSGNATRKMSASSDHGMVDTTSPKRLKSQEFSPESRHKGSKDNSEVHTKENSPHRHSGG